MNRVVALHNEHGAALLPLLGRLAELRRGYRALRRGDIIPSEDPLRQVLAALRDPRVRKALDPLLAREQLAPGRLSPSSDVIEREAKLGRLFGFSEKEMKTHMKSALKWANDTGDIRAISTVEQLEQMLIANHKRASAAALSLKAVPWYKRRKAARQAELMAESGVYCAGSIVADGLHRELFAHSYAFATRNALAAEL